MDELFLKISEMAEANSVDIDIEFLNPSRYTPMIVIRIRDRKNNLKYGLSYNINTISRTDFDVILPDIEKMIRKVKEAYD